MAGRSAGLLNHIMQKSGLGSDGWFGVLVWVVWGRFFLDPLRQWWTAS
jgi:hypothetical protein